MKQLPRSVRGAISIGIAFFALQTFQASLLHTAFAQEERILADRLASAVGGVLNQAHRMKDDLLTFQVLDGLEQSPGILAVRILKQAPTGVASYPLKDGADVWGNLMLVISDHFSQTLVRRQWLAGLAAGAFVWLTLLLYLQWLERESSQQRTQIAELTALLATEKQRAKAAQERDELRMKQEAALLQKAIHRISEPTVVLDAQQRIAALSLSALEKIGVPADAVGKSWHEIAVLNSCGSGLERSLTSPGQAIDWAAQDGLNLKFETEPDGMSGTWVTLVESKELVK